jgi:hypothetical protein
MRRIIQLLEAVPNRQLSRAELEAVLIEKEGYHPSNLLRSLRRLERMNCLILREARHKEESLVALPRCPVTPVSDDVLAGLLAEVVGRK